MPAGIDATQKAIDPGSTEYGERGALEAGISAGMGPASGRGVPGTPPPGVGAPSPTDPIGALLSGEIQGDSDPVTSGLAVGPGPGPANQSPMMSTRAQRLRTIATEAASPVARASARRALRLMTRESI